MDSVLRQRLFDPDGKLHAEWADNYVLQGWWERRRWQRINRDFEQLNLFDHVGQEWKFKGFLLVRVRGIFADALQFRASNRWYACVQCTCCWPTDRFLGVPPHRAHPKLVIEFFDELESAVQGLAGVEKFIDGIFTFKFGPADCERSKDGGASNG